MQSAENDNDQKKAEASTSQQSLSYTQKMINTIVDNFQLFINDVHVRYEDDISHPGVRLQRYFAASLFAATRSCFLEPKCPRA